MRGLALAALLGLAACAAEPPEPAATARPAPAANAACDGSFRVTNNSSRPVNRIFWRDSALTAWGFDQLGLNLLEPSRTTNFRVRTPGLYDIRILWADGRALERRNINICSGQVVTIGNFAINAP
ncbi:MAG: hypothetical protein WCP77_02360 [Roseococcus sp.]